MESRKNNFNIIRFCAAIMVMAGHMGTLIGVSPLNFLGTSLNGEGIAIFFLIGGYLITKSWHADPHVPHYVIKRAFRILPSLIGYVVAATFVFGPFLSVLSAKDYFASPLIGAYLKNIAFYVNFSLPGVFLQNPYMGVVNGSLWSLPVEVLMYFLVPVILIIISRFHKNTKWYDVSLAAITGLICALRMAQMLLFPEWHFVVYNVDFAQVVAIVPYYFIGMLYTLPSLKKRLNLQVASVLLLLSLNMSMSAAKMEMLRLIVIPYFVFSLAFAESPYFCKLFSKYELSYGMYLYGFFVQQAVIQIWGVQRFSFTILLLISIIITICLSWLSSAFIERPAEKLKNNVLGLLKRKQSENRN